MHDGSLTGRTVLKLEECVVVLTADADRPS